MKYLFIDVETTGIDKDQHAIIQLSGIIEIDGQVKEEFDFSIKPHPGAKIDEEALRVTGTSASDLENFTPPYIVFKEFIGLLETYISPYDKKDKFFFVAYNAVFDMEFIRSFFIRNQNQYFFSYFWHPALDVMFLAAEHLKHFRKDLPNFKLFTVAKALNIEIQEELLHNSLYDIHITKIIYNTIIHNENSTNTVFTQEPILNQKVQEIKIQTEEKKEITVEEKEYFNGLF